MGNFLSLLLVSVMLIFTSCSSSQVDDAKLSLAVEAGRGVEAGFVSLAEKELSSADFEALSCDAEAAYYRSKVTSKLKDKLGVSDSDVVASKSFVGDACKVVLPLALDYAVDEADLRPCAKKMGRDKLSGLGDMACEFVDSKL